MHHTLSLSQAHTSWVCSLNSENTRPPTVSYQLSYRFLFKEGRNQFRAVFFLNSSASLKLRLFITEDVDAISILRSGIWSGIRLRERRQTCLYFTRSNALHVCCTPRPDYPLRGFMCCVWKGNYDSTALKGSTLLNSAKISVTTQVELCFLLKLVSWL